MTVETSLEMHGNPIATGFSTHHLSLWVRDLPVCSLTQRFDTCYDTGKQSQAGRLPTQGKQPGPGRGRRIRAPKGVLLLTCPSDMS